MSRHRIPYLFRSALQTLALVTSVWLPGTASAETALPKPYVSRSLDAVLLPVTDAVRAEFGLGRKAAGAVVASVEPGGTGAFHGIEPGDVISKVGGKLIRRPVDIDSMLRYGLGKGDAFFALDGVRRDNRIRTWIELSQEDYEKPVALDRLRNWRAFGGRNASRRAGYFYYPDYWEFYGPVFYEVWDFSYIYIEEIIVTEVFITSYESTEEVFFYDETVTGTDWPDDDYLEEVDGYLYSEEFAAAYASDEVLFEDEIADDMSVEDMGDDMATGDDAGLDEADTGPTAETQSATEDPAPDEALADEQVYDDAAVEEASEEPATEEAAYEEPAAEEVYEEPAYEEPAAEEPAYEEPASDEGGGCTYDEDGNEIC